MNTTFGRYRILERLGQGGMADVFKAKSFGVEGFEKILVIKRILPSLAEHSAFVERFIHEAKLAVRLSHANIVQVFDLGREPSTTPNEPDAYFMAMEYVQGFDLATVRERARERNAAMPNGIALYIASEVAKGLDHAHRRRDEKGQPLGIVHCDVSPHNVLVSFEGEVKVTDFGIARARSAITPDAGAASTHLEGKLGYMSPEQARGESIDARTDLYSLGVVLYELLTGVHPFSADSEDETRRRVKAAEFPPIELLRPDLPTPLVEFVRKTLSLKPSDRFADAGRMYEAALAYLYSTGERSGPHELAEYIGRLREVPSLVPAPELERAGLPDHTPVEVPRRAASQVSSPPPPSVTEAGQLASLGERRDTTALFFEISDRRQARAPREEYAQARAILERYGAHVLDREEPGLFALFGLGSPDGRDTELAVRAGLVLLRSLESHVPSVGIHTGRVHLSRDAKVSDDGRLRALLASSREYGRARIGACVISSSAERSVSRYFELEPIHPDEAKSGLLGAVVTGIKSAREAFGRFVGRREEIRIIGETIARAKKRSAQVLTVRGDHGSGKTRLFVEVERRLVKGEYNVAFYRAECPPQGAELPLSGITSMLQSLCGIHEGDSHERVLSVQPRLRALGLHADEVASILSALGAPITAQAPSAKNTLKNSFARMVARLAEDKPYLLLWDSAHSLDEDSLELIKATFSRAANTRVVFALAGRAGFSHPLEGEDGHTVLELADLRVEDSEELIRERLGVKEIPKDLSRFIRERAGGHPKFLEEVLGALVDTKAVVIEGGAVSKLRLVEQEMSLPRTLRGLVASRIARLAVEPKRTLHAAAILGVRMETLVLSQMVSVGFGDLDSTIDELERHDLLARTSAEELSFSSPIVREVVLDMLTPEATMHLHAAAALAVEAVLSDGKHDPAARIAHHLFQSGNRPRAAQFYAKSGEAALARGQYDRAAADLARAIELSGPKADAWLGPVLEKLSQAVRFTRTCRDADSILAKALEVINGYGDKSVRVHAYVNAGVLFSAMHRFEPARAHFLEAERIADGDERLAKRVLFAYAELASRQGDFNRAIAMLERLQQIATEEGNRAEEQEILYHQALAHAGLGNRPAALAVIARSERLFPEGEAADYGRERLRGLVDYFTRAFKESLTRTESALELAKKIGLPYEIALVLHDMGELLVRLDDFPRAYGIFRQSIELSDEGGFERLSNHNRLFVAYLDGVAGEFSAEHQLRQGIAYAEANDFMWDALNGRFLLAKLLGGRGHTEQAIEEFEEALELANDSGHRLIADDCHESLKTLRTTSAP